jgi:hypothetical protein
MVVRGWGEWSKRTFRYRSNLRVSLGGNTATNHAGDAKDACAKEGQGSGLGDCGRVRQTDEALQVNRFLVLSVAFGGAWRGDPIEFADQRG